MARSLLKDTDISRYDLQKILEEIRILKPRIASGKSLDTLQNKIVCMLFEKPSTRTRNSFESACLRLGGQSVHNAYDDMQLKRGEPIKDTARMLGSYFNAIVARVYSQDTLDELSEYSGIPVVNALSDLCHPTQAVCDMFTIWEVKGKLEGLTLAYIGDGNNVCHSLIVNCAKAGINTRSSCPAGYLPDPEIVLEAKKAAERMGTEVEVVSDPRKAAEGADVLYTDVWVSMGDDAENEKRLKDFDGYQINSDLLKIANEDAVVMHCLPAHRGLEITDEVIEGPQSVVWKQGANKMYGAAGILKFFLA